MTSIIVKSTVKPADEPMVSLVDDSTQGDTRQSLDRDASSWRVVDRLGPLLRTDSEHEAWNHAVSFARRHFAADLSAAFEFVSDDRATFRSAAGFTGHLSDVFAVAPDSLAAYVRASNEVCVSNDIANDSRFEEPGLLTAAGVRSSMTRSFDLADGDRGLIGVYSRAPGFFAGVEHRMLDVLASVLGITIDRIRNQRELEVNARTDSLTGVDNRSTVLAELDNRISCGCDVTALLIDLDGFKSVNDQHGHRTGDRVLRTIAERLTRSIEAGDHLGRLGGDEFLILCDGYTDTVRAEQLIGHIEEIVTFESRTIGVSASIGVSRSRTGDDVSSMLERADRLMYAAKAMGRGHVRADVPLDPAVEAGPAPTRMRANTDLAMVDDAIANLEVVVQPVVEAASGILYGVEALTRGPEGSALEFPERLFNAATTFGRVGDLEVASKRRAFDLDLPDALTLFINLEPALLCDEAWLRRLTDVWTASGSTRPVVAEVTERSVMEHPGRLIEAVAACRSLGWRIALDDVGARSESLAALRWIEPDIVKLDMSLIRNENPAHSAHVVAAVAAYRANSTRRRVIVIAEGVETQADTELADVLGADLLQGYLYGRPVPVDEIAMWEHVAVDAATTRPIPHLGERIGSRADLLAMSRHIEAAALSADCMVLSTVQHVSNFTRRTRLQYRAMARRCGFVGVLGTDVTSVPESEITGIRLVDLTADDELTSTWQVLAMSPTLSLGLIATEVEPQTIGRTDDMDRLFRYRLVSRPNEVEQAVRRLLRYF